MSDFGKLYIMRKCGEKMSWNYRVSALIPLLIIFLISAVLSFSMIFISSVSERIDRMLQLFGSGTIAAVAVPENLPEGTEVSLTCTSQALLYSADGTTAAAVKGVMDGYFDGYRSEELELSTIEGEFTNPSVISSALASALGLELGDRLTMMIMDTEGRARPYLLTVRGIFASVYPQLDSHLIYVPLELVDGTNTWEILLAEGEDDASVLSAIRNEGIFARSYREIYSSAYRNIGTSLSVMHLVLAAVAVLAAYFSSDIAESYTSRDEKDIKALLMMGLPMKTLRAVYLRITMAAVSMAAIAGIVAGTLLSFFSPSLISMIASRNASLLAYYVTSLEVSIPFASLIVMLLLMLAVSAFSVFIFLRRMHRSFR